MLRHFICMSHTEAELLERLTMNLRRSLKNVSEIWVTGQL